MNESNKSSEVVELEQGTVITELSEIGPVTVRRLTDEYVAALEELTGSAVAGVEIDVDRCWTRDSDGCVLYSGIVDIETSIKTR